jgi:hypothetical protein
MDRELLIITQEGKRWLHQALSPPCREKTGYITRYWSRDRRSEYDYRE